MLPKSIINLQKLYNLRAGMKPKNENFSYSAYEVEGVMDSRACMLALVFMASCLFCCAPRFIDEDDLSRCDVCTRTCCSRVPALAMRLEYHGVLVPRGMRSLKALRTLGIVNIARRGKAILQDIKGLTWLRKLAVTGVNKENGQELCTAVVALSRLESLSIRSEGKPGLSGCLDGTFSFPESLQCLKLYGNLVKLPEWIEGLKNLVKLKLRSCRISEHDDAIQVLGKLPSLASLHLLQKSVEGEEVHLSFRPETFQSLMVLELEIGENLKSVNFEGGAMPKLQLLKLYLREVNSSSLSGLPSLAGLKEVVLSIFYSYRVEQLVRAELALNPNRPVLKMK